MGLQCLGIHQNVSTLRNSVILGFKYFFNQQTTRFFKRIGLGYFEHDINKNKINIDYLLFLN